jgi:hypothetical protein
MTSSRNPRPISRVARSATGVVAIALCFGSSLAVALPPDAPLAGDERETPKRPRDGDSPRADRNRERDDDRDRDDRDRDDRDRDEDAPKKKPDAGAPRESPDEDERPPKDPDAGEAPPKDPDAGAAPPPCPECVHVRTEARYVAYGYDHIVEIENECEKTMLCTVMTDVNPQAASVSVAAGQTRSITTFRGSPAREFKATVLCDEPGDDGD